MGKKKMETSKKILCISYAIGIVLTLLTIITAMRGYDASALVALTGIAYAEISVSNAFYFNKAKKENALKIALGCTDMDRDKAEKLTRIIEVIGNIN